MRQKYNQSGSIHLVAISAVLVMVAVAAIGVRVFNTSHAATVASNLVKITSPQAGTTIVSYKVLVASVNPDRKVTSMKFFANDKLIPNAGSAKCYPPPGPIPVPALGSYTTCFDSQLFPSGTYNLTAKVVFGNGTAATSAPVSVRVDHGIPPPPPTPSLTVKITQPLDNAQVSGYVPVLATVSSNVTKVGFSANGKTIVDAGLTKCYPTALPTPAPNTFLTCLNTQDAVYVNASSIVLAATGFDAAGNSAVSPTVTVTHPIATP